jgi:Major royal jelly protein
VSVDSRSSFYHIYLNVTILDNQIKVQRPSIWTIDLKTEKAIGRFEIPSNIVDDGTGLASLTIDDDICTKSFAYLPDWLNNLLIVYSFEEQKMWRFNHNFFHFNPFEGDFLVDGKSTLFVISDI